MSVNWTEEQKQVIESRGSNLLVSAAAGSGKTAVLVERIIRMVTDEKHPLDIDKLLVMTFTNAAAAEMRERIGAAIEQKLEEAPEDEHLQAQAALVHHAQITTIDSFCVNLIRSHFNMLDLDPAFRIGDEGELMLLRADAMQELLEGRYENGGPPFERFVEAYSQGKSDASIETYIMQVYTFSQSNPYPAWWFAQCREEWGGDGEGPEGPYPWMEFLMADVKRQAREWMGQIREALEECRADEYLCAYEPMLQEDIRMLKSLEQVEDFARLPSLLSSVKWPRLASVRSKDVDGEKKAYITNCRDRVKKAVAKMRDLYAFGEWGEMCRDLAGTREPVQMLLDLAEEFSRRYQEKKRERNLVDFNDLEHEALKVLIHFPETGKEGPASQAQEEDGAFGQGEGGDKTVLARPEESPGQKGAREDKGGGGFGRFSYTEAADQVAMQFEEVLVDEYQDSNLVQEALLGAVSRERFGHPNVFMVGDVKQSIYKFRLARPELFLEKYHTYQPYGEPQDRQESSGGKAAFQEGAGAGRGEEGSSQEKGGGGGGRKIELHRNFRSREQVLAGINDIFFRIMTENLGNIQYTQETALHPGARFAEAGAPIGYPELLLVDTGAGALAQMEEEAADYTAKELEAKVIAGRIRELTDPENGLQVWDKKLGGAGGYRTARYQDMAVLLRSTAGWTETLLSVLMNEGIPAYAESRTGYFNTAEVETVLSMLAAIDNPMQDIPLAAVLKSPMVGMSDKELALMMARYRGCANKGQNRGVYGAIGYCLANGQEGGPDEGWVQKLREFTVLLKRLRDESAYLPIHELIYHVFEATGYYNYVSAMPAGETRKANLDMLVEKAAAYGQTSYKGLFHFIRYIENLKKYHTDFGEASTLGEEDNTVRIMSIHKSKGLEFPIVFLAGTGKKFNRQDIYGKVLIDPELGIGTDYLDLEHRVKTTTLKKNVLKRKMDLENLGEELRVLYVAMTRAKEKLIMTGTDRHLEAKLEKYAHVPLVDGQVPFTILSTANSYLDWLLMGISDGKARVAMAELPLWDFVGEELVRQMQSAGFKGRLLEMDPDKAFDKGYRQKLEQGLGYEYPYQADIQLYTEISVSELKKQGQMVDASESIQQEGPLNFVWEQWLEKRAAEDAMAEEAPSKVKAKPSGYGATRGTAYHRALELLPFDQVEGLEDVKSCLKGLVENKQFSRESMELVQCGEIWAFLSSGLGQRMRKAQKEGRLYKEQQFILGIPAREIGAGDSDELVVVQGILDAYMEEGDGLVLVDYKTDRVQKASTLVEHYQKQIDYYAVALNRITGKAVKEKVIYSLALQQEIAL